MSLGGNLFLAAVQYANVFTLPTSFNGRGAMSFCYHRLCCHTNYCSTAILCGHFKRQLLPVCRYFCYTDNPVIAGSTHITLSRLLCWLHYRTPTKNNSWIAPSWNYPICSFLLSDTLKAMRTRFPTQWLYFHNVLQQVLFSFLNADTFTVGKITLFLTVSGGSSFI